MNNRILMSISLILSAMILSGCGRTNISQNDSKVTVNTLTASSGETSEIEIIGSDVTVNQATVIEDISEIRETTTYSGTITTAAELSVKSGLEIPHEPVKSTDEIITEINEIFFPVRKTGALYSVMVMDINESVSFDAGNCDTPMVSASLIKLYVAGAVYEQLDKIKEYETYLGETEYLLNIMISQSDNDACNTLVTRLGNRDSANGMSVVNKFCRAHGFNGTEMNRLMLDFNGLENYTTPTDCCKILKCYLQNELLGSESVVEFMKNQVTRTKIPAGVKDGTVVANKSGELSTVENDAAIIYADSSTYLMCAMTNNLTDTAGARNAIAVASSYIFDFMNN